MPQPDFRRVVPGQQQIPASLLNRLSSDTMALANVSGVGVSQGAGGIQFPGGQAPYFYARVVSGLGGSPPAYLLSRLLDAADGEWALPGNVTEVTGYDLNGLATVPIDAEVQAWPGAETRSVWFDGAGVTAVSGGGRLAFEYEQPPGTHHLPDFGAYIAADGLVSATEDQNWGGEKTFNDLAYLDGGVEVLYADKFVNDPDYPATNKQQGRRWVSVYSLDGRDAQTAEVFFDILSSGTTDAGNQKSYVGVNGYWAVADESADQTTPAVTSTLGSGWTAGVMTKKVVGVRGVVGLAGLSVERYDATSTQTLTVTVAGYGGQNFGGGAAPTGLLIYGDGPGILGSAGKPTLAVDYTGLCIHSRGQTGPTYVTIAGESFAQGQTITDDRGMHFTGGLRTGGAYDGPNQEGDNDWTGENVFTWAGSGSTAFFQVKSSGDVTGDDGFWVKTGGAGSCIINLAGWVSEQTGGGTPTWISRLGQIRLADSGGTTVCQIEPLPSTAGGRITSGVSGGGNITYADFEDGRLYLGKNLFGGGASYGIYGVYNGTTRVDGENGTYDGLQFISGLFVDGSSYVPGVNTTL